MTLAQALARIAELEALVAFHAREKEKTVQLLRQWDRYKTKIVTQRRDIARLEEALARATPA